MKANVGIIRRIDNLGRIVIPAEMRRALGIRKDDPVSMELHGDCVSISRYNEHGAVKEYLNRIAMMPHPNMSVDDEMELHKHARAIENLFRQTST